MSKTQNIAPDTTFLNEVLSALESGTPWSEIAPQKNVDKTTLYSQLFQKIDQDIDAEIDHHIFSETPRDRLFEILMMRFDILNTHRNAYQQLFKLAFKDGALFRKALPQFHASMDVMLRLIDLNGRDGKAIMPLRVGAVALVYLNAARVWLRDDSPDMARTMAELDKGLNQLDLILEKIPAPLRHFL